jgi:DNA-binding XRE family transcriptional regulator
MKVRIGNRLKTLRGQNSQTNMAKIMGVSQSCWQAWEVGKNEPNLTAVHDICTQFNCSSDWLLGLKAKTPAKNGNTLKNEDIGRDCSKCDFMKTAIKMVKSQRAGIRRPGD